MLPVVHVSFLYSQCCRNPIRTYAYAVSELRLCLADGLWNSRVSPDRSCLPQNSWMKSRCFPLISSTSPFFLTHFWKLLMTNWRFSPRRSKFRLIVLSEVPCFEAKHGELFLWSEIQNPMDGNGFLKFVCHEEFDRRDKVSCSSADAAEYVPEKSSLGVSFINQSYGSYTKGYVWFILSPMI